MSDNKKPITGGNRLFTRREIDPNDPKDKIIFDPEINFDLINSLFVTNAVGVHDR